MSADIVKNNCDRWIRHAYEIWLGWLRRTKPEQYHLRESTRILVNRMRNAVSESSNEEAWNHLERLKKLGNSINGMRNDFGGDGFLYEQAEINLECAVVAYNMGDAQEAGTLLDMIGGSFTSRSVHKAVTCWIHGCIQWQSQSHFDSALVNWEKGCHIMTELAGNNSFDQNFAEGCQVIADVMSHAIRDASSLGYPPLPPGQATRPTATAQPDPGPSARPRNPGGGGYSSSRIHTYPVIGSIPAGAPAGFVDDAPEKAVSDGYRIGNELYKAYNLSGGMDININQNNRYYLLGVNGDSMNDARPVNIENGDYVLMVKQESANGGDIVAAVIDGVDLEATLKRFYYREGRPALRAESRNPANNNLLLDGPFNISGKAVAVLKRDG